MVLHVSNMGDERSTLQEHHDWALKLWNRMDRDGSGTIRRKELDCEEFRDVLRQVIAPHAKDMPPGIKGGNAGYARVQQNVEQAVDFCLRKADFNNDTSLSFQEFKSFLMVLRSKQDASETASLIFALFDLDGDARISQTEFREIYRYYLGHHPTVEDFVAEWRRLDAGGNDEVTREEYIRWLQTSKNPIFKQHAPPLRGFSSDALSSLSGVNKKTRAGWTPDAKDPASLLGVADQMSRTAPSVRARWNQNFNTQKNMNYEMPAIQRNYFSRPQSLPELTRYFELHRGFNQQTDRMKTVPETRRHKAVLSTESTPSLIPARDGPGGTMRHPISRRPVGWNDHWQEPKSMKKRILPVTLMFQCPGKPPMDMFQRGEDDI